MQNILMKWSALYSRLTYRIAVCTFALLPILMASCKNNGNDGDNTQWIEKCSVIADKVTVGSDTVITCNMSAVKESLRIPFSTFFDTLEVIKLDNSNEDALVGEAHMITVTDNYLGINVAHYPYKLFTRQGKFIGRVGNIGQGPGEYNLLYDSQIDEANNRIYLLPWNTEQILSYDLKGNYAGSIPLPYRVRKGKIKVDYDKKRVTVLQLAFMGDPVAWVQDMEGNILFENKSPQMDMEPSYSNEIYLHRTSDSGLIFSINQYMPSTDSLYTYRTDNNRLIPLFTTDFGSEMPSHNYQDCGNYYITDIYGPNTNPKTMHLYTALVVKRIIVDKRTLRGAYFKMVNTKLGGIALESRRWFMNEYGYTVCWDPGDLLDLIEERLADPKISTDNREFLNVWKSKISPDDNGYVILGKKLREENQTR